MTSSQYGLLLYHIYRAGFRLAAVDNNTDKATLKTLLDDYDQSWAQYRQLKGDHPSCATLYTDLAFQEKPGLGAMVDELRKRLL